MVCFLFYSFFIELHGFNLLYYGYELPFNQTDPVVHNVHKLLMSSLIDGKDLIFPYHGVWFKEKVRVFISPYLSFPI